MSKFLIILSCWLSTISSLPHYDTYFKVVPYGYPDQYFGPTHSDYVDPISFAPYDPSTYGPDPATYGQLNALPTINILAEPPYSIDTKFTVVPMLAVPADNLNMISDAEIISVSKKKPTVTIKMNKDKIQCTPAVKITLETPIVIYNVKTSVVFPSQMAIRHGNVRIPIRVGAVIAIVPQDLIVSDETPVSVGVVYAIPTKPVEVDYVNNEKDVVIDVNAQAVIVENNEMSNNTGAATVKPDDDEDELVNRNPPLTEAAMEHITQTGTSNLGVFSNPKESPVLTELREESMKRI